MPNNALLDLVLPPFLLNLCVAAIEATHAWSCHDGSLPDLDPAMQRLHEALRPLLDWQQARNTSCEHRSP